MNYSSVQLFPLRSFKKLDPCCLPQYHCLFPSSLHMDHLRSGMETLHRFISDPSNLTVSLHVPSLVGAAGATMVGYVVLRYIWELIPAGGTKQKAVFITGCDSGFGRALSLKCAKAGFTVFSGCLTEEGRYSLSKEAASLPLFPVPLDITKDESVVEARKIVGEKLGDKTLWAVVNNAGIFSCYGLAEWCTSDEYKLSFEVNLLGAVRVTNAFLDLLKRSKGRLISVSSVAGRIAAAGSGPYSVAKYGVEAWNDVMRRELRPFGVSVHLVEPGIFKATNLLDVKAHSDRVSSVWKKMKKELREEYGEEYKEELIEAWNGSLNRMGSTNINLVVDNYFHALTAYFPRLRYQCGWDAILIWYPASFMPTPIQDRFLNLLSSKAPVPSILKRGGFGEKKMN
ncbi:hypothetical protein PMAYCL1PPCAC_28986 [Pristionchus mayeri]|uniref:Dehydrogenase n=1 Tax=Pristionchus mayeri TaxID=1317129 RepID=A0AAN5D8J3_9BILA|nr:hypothetical protein PMAYCL1PPCAC_28986 [Pristionchus mayeri]